MSSQKRPTVTTTSTTTIGSVYICNTSKHFSDYSNLFVVHSLLFLQLFFIHCERNIFPSSCPAYPCPCTCTCSNDLMIRPWISTLLQSSHWMQHAHCRHKKALSIVLKWVSIDPDSSFFSISSTVFFFFFRFFKYPVVL